MQDHRRWVVRIFGCILAIYGLAINAYYIIFNDTAMTSLWAGVFFVLLFPLIWILFPIENLLHKYMPMIIALGMGDEKRIIGEWNIQITYSERKRKQLRTGNLKISPSIYGLVINGGKLLNTETGVKLVTMESWRADDVYLYPTKGGKILTYIYRTNEGVESTENDRTGVVTCFFETGKDQEPITGVFRDAEGAVENRREGTVRLVRVDLDTV